MPSFYTSTSIPAISVRMINYDRSIRIKNLRGAHHNQFVSLTGTVVKLSNRKPFASRLAFECNICKSTLVS